LTGQAAYEAHCASCHDTGLDDAPVTGSPGDWFERSQLWQAVLMEHARAGYLEMPKRGGNPELSDIEVDAAAEYMLAITYPDRPPDN
jgi:cytochrome c5